MLCVVATLEAAASRPSDGSQNSTLLLLLVLLIRVSDPFLTLVTF